MKSNATRLLYGSLFLALTGCIRIDDLVLRCTVNGQESYTKIGAWTYNGDGQWYDRASGAIYLKQPNEACHTEAVERRGSQ